MQIKGFKIWLILISCIVALGLLVGGSYYYKKLNVDQPLFKLYGNIKEVKNFELKEQGQNLEITLHLEKTKNLQRTYQEIFQGTEEIVGAENFNLLIEDNPSEELEEILDNSQLTIYQALVTGDFPIMAEKLKLLAKEHNADAKIFMDNENIFIQLEKNDNYLYKIIKWQNYKISAS